MTKFKHELSLRAKNTKFPCGKMSRSDRPVHGYREFRSIVIIIIIIITSSDSTQKHADITEQNRQTDRQIQRERERERERELSLIHISEPTRQS